MSILLSAKRQHERPGQAFEASLGLGIERDENLAMMWLHKAAAQGHVIAQAQTSALRDLAVQQLASGAAAWQAG